jgi:mono/diheme cytochrome c family protein
MNVSFNASQTSAVISPSAAPLSTSQAAIPDPAYSSSTAAVNLDGPALYAANCSSTSCHGSLANSNKKNRTFEQIKAAIGTIGQMASLGALTDAQLQAIATALKL